MKPTAGRAVLVELKSEEVSSGGIVLPGTAAKDYTAYRVVAVGNGVILPQGTRVELGINPGDVVLAAKSMGSLFRHRGVDYTLMDFVYIGAVLE